MDMHRQAAREQLQLEIDQIVIRTDLATPAELEGQPAAAAQEPDAIIPFGAWLLERRDRGEWIGLLADGARRDPGFPRHGSPDDVRARLTAMEAESDMFERLDDAETMWLAE